MYEVMSISIFDIIEALLDSQFNQHQVNECSLEPWKGNEGSGEEHPVHGSLPPDRTKLNHVDIIFESPDRRRAAAAAAVRVRGIISPSLCPNSRV